MTSAPESRDARYRRDIDGLRGIAVASVLCFHAFPDAVSGGFVGVDVFFVISGYLITGILWRGLEDGTFRFGTFYARRVRRIFPALSVVLVASLAIGWFTLLPPEYARLGKHTLGGAFFASNFVLWGESGYFDKATELKPLLHLWSLAIEEQFYLVWPLVLVAASRLRVSLVTLGIAAVSLSFYANVVGVKSDLDGAFYSPATRAWELALGALLVRVTPLVVTPVLRELSAAAGALALASSFFVLSRLTPFPGWAATLPTLATCLLLLAGPEAWVNKRVLSSRALVSVGLVSYPLYLWHWPLLSFARILSLDTPPAATRIAMLALAAALATATYALFERPIRRGRGGRRAVLGLAAAIAVLGLVGLVVADRGGFASRIAPPLRQYVSRACDMDADVNHACWLSGKQQTHYPPSCADGDKRGPAVFLWGDSFAARFAPGLRRVLGESARMGQFTKSSCPPILAYGVDGCPVANAQTLATIRAERPEVVILMANWVQQGPWSSPDDDVARRLRDTLASVAAAGVPRIVVMGPAPQWRDDLPRVLATATFRDAAHRHVPRRMTFGVEPAVRDVDRALSRLVATADRVTYVSPSDLMCNEEGCLTRVDDEPDGLTTCDYGHLTTKGATYLARAVESAHPGLLPRAPDEGKAVP
jgi:peptidoglycan/LPS O-acetylase OafA/YrhL